MIFGCILLISTFVWLLKMEVYVCVKTVVAIKQYKSGHVCVIFKTQLKPPG